MRADWLLSMFNGGKKEVSECNSRQTKEENAEDVVEVDLGVFFSMK